MTRTHGMSETRLYKVWSEMKRRCNNPNDNVYKYYGGRGISYSKEWERFEPFMEWALSSGYDFDAKRGATTLDRIDNDKDYSPENCRWISQTEQARNNSKNRHIVIDGEDHILSEWSEISGIQATTIKRRLNMGFTARDAVFREVGSMRNLIVLEMDGVTHTVREWSRILGCSKNAIRERLRRGWSVRKALTTEFNKTIDWRRTK